MSAPAQDESDDDRQQGTGNTSSGGGGGGGGGRNVVAAITTSRENIVMPALIASMPVTNWVIRGALSFLVPFIARDNGMGEGERAALLAAFYPGYVAGHVPGGWAVQRFGGKAVLAVNMAGTAALCCALPLAARVRQNWRCAALSMGLMSMGFFQGPLIPALQHMRKDWLPQGPGRALAMRLSDLGGALTGVLTPLLPPFVAMRYGWRSFVMVYGVYVALFLAVWQRWARDRPAHMVAAQSHAPQAVDWTIFLESSVLAMICAQFGSGFSVYTLQQWQPIYFMCAPCLLLRRPSTGSLGRPAAAVVCCPWRPLSTDRCVWVR
jgi:ACS family D-galactonate transporter-like MFS transporter